MKKVKLGKIMGDEFVQEDLEDDNIYDEDARELLMDDDAISVREAAFMKGYEESFELEL